MTSSGAAQGNRNVKGTVIIDYLKIMRANPKLAWSDYLTPEDLETLDQMILPSSWYPVELFQRLGIAVFELVSRRNLKIVRGFGRFIADHISADNPGVIVAGDPLSAIKKYLLIQSRLYSFKLIEKGEEGPGRVVINIFSNETDRGMPLYIEAATGSVERLIELSGGREIEVRRTAYFKQDGHDSLEFTWKT